MALLRLAGIVAFVGVMIIPQPVNFEIISKDGDRPHVVRYGDNVYRCVPIVEDGQIVDGLAPTEE
jgi:hypothetical protein